MTIEKWKTFPCKTCLLKHKCNKTCFKFPDTINDTDVSRYMAEHVELKEICLCCGEPRDVFYYWACQKCNDTVLKNGEY